MQQPPNPSRPNARAGCLPLANRLCCFALETGLKCLAWLQVVLVSLVVLYFAATRLFVQRKPTAEDRDDYPHHKTSAAEWTTVAIIAAVAIGSAVLVLLAIQKRNRFLLLPSMLFHATAVSAWLFAMLVLVLFLFQPRGGMAGYVIFHMVFMLTPLGLVGAYKLYCMYSLFVHLRNEELRSRGMGQMSVLYPVPQQLDNDGPNKAAKTDTIGLMA